MDAIVFSNFTKKYGKLTAVRRMNLVVPKGSIVGFVGKNGAGKSTALRALVNVISPTGGKIFVKGLDSVKDSKEIKQFLSYMPSDAAFYDDITAADLFQLCAKFCAADLEKAEEMAKYFELDVHKKISTLSLGNRKKVSIIQALLKDSEIFVMDEPTSGLDPLMQEKFFAVLLERKKQGATIFLSSHNLGEIEKYCDRAVIIKNGQIVDSIDMKTAKQYRKQMVSYQTTGGLVRRFAYDGKINDLIAELSRLDLKELEIRPASIEESFIKYYTEDETKVESENE